MTKKELVNRAAIKFRVNIRHGATVTPDTAYDALAEVTPTDYHGATVSAREILATAKRM